MTHDRPTAPELIEAVSEFLTDEVLPGASDHRQKFRMLVALNALSIARRELDSAGNDLVFDGEQLTELAARIRAGDVPDDAFARLKAHVEAKLRVSNPGYLERYR